MADAPAQLGRGNDIRLLFNRREIPALPGAGLLGVSDVESSVISTKEFRCAGLELDAPNAVDVPKH